LGNVSANYLLYLDDEGFLSEEELELVRRFRQTDDRRRPLSGWLKFSAARQQARIALVAITP
jgi:hypothetical protein